MTDTLESRFHKAMVEAFGEHMGAYDQNTWLMQLGNERQVDDLFDELEMEFPGYVEDEQRAAIKTVGEAWAWAHQAHQLELAEAAEEEAQRSEADKNKPPSPFAWRDELSMLQKGILKISGVIGVVMFFVGVQLIVRGKKELGGTLTAAGMFLSTQMFWGLKKCYNWLEKKHLGLLRKIGYKGLFWIFLIGTYTAEVIGLAAVFKFLGLEIPELPK